MLRPCAPPSPWYCCSRSPAAASPSRPPRSRSAAPSRVQPATAAKDYQALCDRILAPSLIADLKKIGLPCEIALQQGLGEVEQPKLIVGDVKVEGKKATAQVRTSAQGQAPSSDTVQLERTDEGWRIASLATPSETGPAP